MQEQSIGTLLRCLVFAACALPLGKLYSLFLPAPGSSVIFNSIGGNHAHELPSMTVAMWRRGRTRYVAIQLKEVLAEVVSSGLLHRDLRHLFCISTCPPRTRSSPLQQVMRRDLA